MLSNELITAIESAWSETTSARDNTWSAANPAAGHCDVSSLVVRESVGGDLKMAQVFRDGTLSEHHFWNILPDGTEVDLTKSQFDGSETFGEPTLMDDAFFAAAGPITDSLLGRLTNFRIAVSAATVDSNASLRATS